MLVFVGRGKEPTQSEALDTFFTRVGSGLNPQILDKAGKACQGQTL